MCHHSLMSLTASGKSSSRPVPQSPEGTVLESDLHGAANARQSSQDKNAIQQQFWQPSPAKPVCQQTRTLAHAVALLGTSQKQTLQEVTQVAPEGCERLAHCGNSQPHPLQLTTQQASPTTAATGV